MSKKIFNRNAKELFESLTSNVSGEGFSYRGHGRSSYNLEPSFHRPGRKDAFLSLNDSSQLIASTWPIRKFYQTANHMGLPLPSISYRKHQNYIDESEINHLFNMCDEIEKPYDEDELEVMAFAQHYQIPTPLLDWSRSPLVAMYFAASGALRSLISESKRIGENDTTALIADIKEYANTNYMSVWQANSTAINHLSEQRHLIKDKSEDEYSVLFFTPRTQGNRNIIAQQGLFSIHHPQKMTADYRYAISGSKCLSEVVSGHVEWIREKNIASSYLRTHIEYGLLNEYLIPYSEVLNLLKILNSCGINAASIYPDHQGCSNRVAEIASISLMTSLMEFPDS